MPVWLAKLHRIEWGGKIFKDIMWYVDADNVKFSVISTASSKTNQIYVLKNVLIAMLLLLTCFACVLFKFSSLYIFRSCIACFFDLCVRHDTKHLSVKCCWQARKLCHCHIMWIQHTHTMNNLTELLCGSHGFSLFRLDGESAYWASVFTRKHMKIWSSIPAPCSLKQGAEENILT